MGKPLQKRNLSHEEFFIAYDSNSSFARNARYDNESLSVSRGNKTVLFKDALD